MTLAKIFFDNSVNYFTRGDETRERDNKPNTIKKYSFLEKQNKNVLQNNKKVVKDIITGDGFRLLK